MAIQVVCPGCKKRFQVSDKFAGQKGPCPKCKTSITIPEKGEEVMVHAPETYGPKDAKGRAVLKPIAREETKLSVVQVVAIIGAGLLVLLIALMLRWMIPESESFPLWILAAGAVLLGPPLALGGYAFLRDPELEPHRGLSVFLRSLICGLIYAALWGVYAFLPWYFEIDSLEVFHLLMFVPPIVLIGGAAGLAAFEFDYGTGLLHYGLYVAVTVLLCFIAGVPLF